MFGSSKVWRKIRGNKIEKKSKSKEKMKKILFQYNFFNNFNYIWFFFFLNKIKHGKIIFLILCLILENFEENTKYIYN